MQVTKFKFSKKPVTTIVRPTQLGEKLLDGGKSLVGLALVATVNAIALAVFKDMINANVKDVRENTKQAFHYVKNECKQQ